MKWFGSYGNKRKSLGILEEIRDSDTFVASFPKSGNTWIRFILANAMTAEEVQFNSLNSFVPGLYTQGDKINAMSGPRFIKVHDPYFDAYPRCIAIVRDPRDAYVSYFHYQTAHHEYKGSADDFVSSKSYDKPFGSWHDHCQALATEQAKRPNDFLVIRFEDLLTQPSEEIQQILVFSGINPQKSAEEIQNLTSFSALSENESAHGNVFGTDFPFFRKGTSGQWDETFSDKAIDLIMKRNGAMMKHFGYE